MRFPQLQGLVGAPKLKLAATVADAERVMPSLLNESAVEPANRESVKKSIVNLVAQKARILEMI